jgi:hypothetical protein
MQLDPEGDPMTTNLQNVGKSDIRKSNMLKRWLSWFRGGEAPAWTRTKISFRGYGLNVTHEREKLTAQPEAGCLDRP